MRIICLFMKSLLLFILIITAILPNFLCAVSEECGCESSSPSSPPPEPDILTFLDHRLAVVYSVIQNFKITITSDPLGITQTWIGSDVCSYKGFYCDNPPDNLTAVSLAAIDFNGFHLGAPSIDGFIDQLPDIAVFHANSNNFSGTISANIAKLKYLYELDLSNNQFSGTFPTAVLGISDLSFLDLRFNYFSGSVPPQVFDKSLDVFFINNNNFIQRLPDNLGSTPAFYLTFANNKFTGPIPRSIGRASSTLIEVLFLNNQLSGCLPYELGFLRKATVIDAGNNLITGPLPCSLGCLEMAEQLNFAGNLLYGQVPEVVCALGNLVNLNLSMNYFTKIGPRCWNLMRRGVLDLRKNCIQWLPDQRSAADCAKFLWRPRVCPYHATYSTIPCKLPHPRPYNNDHAPAPPHPLIRSNRRHLISYSALSRQRL